MLNEDDLQQTLNLAVKKLKNKEVEQALKTLTDIESESVAQKSEVYLGMLSSIYTSLKMFKKTIECLEKVLVLNPEHHLANFQLGMLYFQNQQQDLCKTYWLPMLNQDKDFTVHYYYSFVAELDKDLNLAKELISKAKTRCDKKHP